MSWLTTQTMLLDSASAAAGFACNWLLQSTLLIAAGLLLGRMARRRGAAVQSVVYRTTLVAVLVCPLATWLLASAGVSGWSLVMPAAWNETPIAELVAVDAEPALAETVLDLELPADPEATVGPLRGVIDVTLDGSPMAAEGELRRETPLQGTLSVDLSEQPVAATELAEPDLADHETIAALVADPQVSPSAFGIAALLGSLVWLLASMLLLARLAFSWWRLAQLRRGAVGADAEAVAVCREVATRLGVRAPQVLMTPHLPSPCLAGLRRPAVLLPDGELSLSLRDVLLHELAHLRRRDVHWNLLRRLATAVFWYQPLLWTLSRRIETTADEVCDDFVLQHGGDRQAYAHRLVDIAELSTTPVAAAGVGIVPLRSMLARRVARIMDTTRSLSTRVGTLLLSLVLVGGLAGTTIVGLVGVGSRTVSAEGEADFEAETTTSKEIDDAGDEAVVEVSAPAGNREQLHGRVVDQEGRPVKDAMVHVVRSRWLRGSSRQVEHEPLGAVSASQDGSFSFVLPRDEVEVDSASKSRHWTAVNLVVMAPGYGTNWDDTNDGPDGRNLEIRLNDSPMEIRGRLVNLEGQPIEGLEVRPRMLGHAKPENLEKWLDDVAALRAEGGLPSSFGRAGGMLLTSPTVAMSLQGEETQDRRNPYYPVDGQLFPGHPLLPVAVTTDSDGRFELAGIGPDQLLFLEISGPGVATHSIAVVARDLERINVADTGFAYTQTDGYYGAAFVHPVAPGTSIRGIVKDADDGTPLAGVMVTTSERGDSTSGIDDVLSSVSDAEGRFQLAGLPIGVRHQLKVIPTPEQPYLITDGVQVPASDGREPVEMEIALRRGVFVTGRVTDAESGEAVQADLHYHPYLDNEHAKRYDSYDPQITRLLAEDGHYRTNPQGEYRIVVIPGRGILAVRAEAREDYCVGLGAEAIGGLDEREHFATYDRCSARLYNRLAEIDVAEDATEVPLDLTVSRGRQLLIQAVAPTGELLTEVKAANRTPFGSGYVQSPDAALVQIVALRPGETRQVLLLHEERKLGEVIEVRYADAAEEPRNAEPREIQLRPCASVIGRLIDGDGEPLASAQLSAHLLPLRDFGITAENSQTAADGSFRFNHLAAGGRYQISGFASRPNFIEIANELDINPGETIDLGTIDVTTDERPEPVRRAAGGAADPVNDGELDGETLPASDAAGKESDKLEFAGRVVDPAGNPAANAELYLVVYVPQPTGLLDAGFEPVATTDEAGEFRFRASPSDYGVMAEDSPFGQALLAAVKPGFGFDWAHAVKFETSGQWLRDTQLRAGEPLQLVADDEPIRGRIIDIEGQPVAGARLTLWQVNASADGDLNEWRKATGESNADSYSARMKAGLTINGPQVRSLVAPAVTDAEGRFTLRGVGRGRIAELLLQGPEIETAKILARTEAGEPIELMREWRSPDLGSYVYHPAELLHVAGPSAEITGTVRDAQTGEPLAGITIKSQARHGERINGLGQDFVRAVTDDQGRYRLAGMPIGRDNRIAAIAPRDEIAYLSISRPAATEDPQRPIEVDFELPRGVWIEGQIMDNQSGKGLVGELGYYVTRDSPSYAIARTMNVDERDVMQSDASGHFRIAALPGPGYVAFRSYDQHQQYGRAEGVLKLDGSFEKTDSSMLETGPSLLMPTNYHIVAEVDPAEDDQRIELNLQVDGGGQILGRVEDPEGNPVTGFYYTGRIAQFDSWTPATLHTFELVGYDAASPRHVYFAHHARNLAGHLVLEGDLSKTEVVARLQPAGTVRGRLVDEDGAPLANCMLHPWRPTPSDPTSDAPQRRAPPLPLNVNHSRNPQYVTDQEGRFEITCLVPGIEYRLRTFDRDSMTPARGRMPRISGPLDVVIKVAPGEERDLGDVRLVDEDKFTQAAIEEAEKAVAVEPIESETVVTAHITDPDGRPIAGADVAVRAVRVIPTHNGQLTSKSEILAQGITDEDGEVEFAFTLAAIEEIRDVCLMARTDGTALAWNAIDPHEHAIERWLVLEPEQVIRGRLVDVDGQPAGRLGVRVQSLVRWTEGRWSNGVGSGGKETPAAWLQPVTTDDEGRFAIHGLPDGYGVLLGIEESDRFAAHEYIAINTGMPEQRGSRDATYRPLVTNVAPGEEAVVVLAPAQWFEGIVTYVDTGEPAAHARVSIWASQQEFGSMASLDGETDAEGRYRVNPRPGIRFGVTAFAPEGTPYLARQTPFSQSIPWESGDQTKTVDMTLPRGVLIRGTVIEAGSSSPVAGAYVQYMPEEANNSSASDDIVTGWNAIKPCDDEGRFAIAVLPGPGWLLVHGPDGKYVLHEMSDRQIRLGKPGGHRYYACAFERLEPDPDDGEIELTVEIERGATVAGTIVDEKGTLIDEALVIWPMGNIKPFWVSWHGPIEPTHGGHFELPGFAPDREYRVHFLDPKRRLGATAVFKAGDESPTVVLKPCGQATAQFVDGNGEPVAGVRASLTMVVTPGVDWLDLKAQENGELVADADALANIDRENYWSLRADDNGQVTYPALIPGATYRRMGYADGRTFIADEFTVEPGETVDLGEIVIERSQ